MPNYSVLNPKTPRAEEAALELACLWNDIDTVVICGHSDCKVYFLLLFTKIPPSSTGIENFANENYFYSNSFFYKHHFRYIYLFGYRLREYILNYINGHHRP